MAEISTVYDDTARPVKELDISGGVGPDLRIIGQPRAPGVGEITILTVNDPDSDTAEQFDGLWSIGERADANELIDGLVRLRDQVWP